ncbi:MAG: helix-turn-helix transcriptional regulator [Acidobacteriota bacterium]|nr:helix-turn-helix transcriptional regulator [Acidobacteriota bacterium]MDH3786151.1 helix-turn-helix transcriptional regulator [Acidobacteriota bacterium]
METFGEQLRGWRSHRGLSQLSLGLNAGTSSRHISFLETGRSRPSRKMVLQLARTMDLPLRQQNAWLTSAGFAPIFGERTLDDDELRKAREAVTYLLAAHEPYPALAMDRHWQFVAWNRPQFLMLQPLADENGSLSGINALDLIFQPGPVRQQLLNWEEVAMAVLRRLHRQRVRVGNDDRLQQLWDRSIAAPDVAPLLKRRDLEKSPPPLVPMKMDYGDQQVTWINTLASFGAVGDATLEELVIESFYPADDATRAFAERLASSGS